MALKYNTINDIILINLADNAGYRFSSFTVYGGCGDQLATTDEELNLPIYQSYQNVPSKGIQLKAKMSIQESLLRQLFHIDLNKTPPIKITTWNVDLKEDIFPIPKSAAIIAETLRAKYLDYNFAPGWPDQVAEAMISEIARLKSDGAKFTNAVNGAMYENQSPKQTLTSIMKLKTFCVQAGRGMLGLGTNAGMNGGEMQFLYNFGASLLFNPVLYITEKGIGRVYTEAYYYPGGDNKPSGDREPICARAIVIYNSTRGRAAAELSSSNLSFAFRPDDTYSNNTAVADEIMAAFRTFSNNQISGPQLTKLKMTEDNWKGGQAWTSSSVIIEGGVRVKVGLNPPNAQGAGVFNVGFAFEFGSENGSLTITNLLLSFTFDVAKYAQSVNAVQQMKARARESVNNYKSQLAAQAAALALANKTVGEAPKTNLDLDKNLLLEGVYTTRDEDAARTLVGGGNITNTPNPTQQITEDLENIKKTNGNKDTRISTENDPTLGG